MERNREPEEELGGIDASDDRVDDLDTTDETGASITGGGIVQGDGG